MPYPDNGASRQLCDGSGGWWNSLGPVTTLHAKAASRILLSDSICSDIFQDENKQMQSDFKQIVTEQNISGELGSV